MKLIKPHGGVLVNREVEGAERQQLMSRCANLRRLQLDARASADVEMIATGAYSPLTGFMDSANYKSVLDGMCLADGTPWSMPITLAASAEAAKPLRAGEDVALFQQEHLLGVLQLAEKFTYDKRTEAQSIYRTTDEAHPGVRALYAQGDWLLAGKITL